MELWTAFIFGLAGSLHCIGMCGPIVLALPIGQKSRISFVIGRVLYNLGRTVTYALMGLAAGWIGQMFVLSGYQNILSICIGVLILLILFLPTKTAARLIPFPFYQKSIDRVKRFWGRLLQNSSHSSLFSIGILNGFLPCGLVYSALAVATTTGTVINGMLYMTLFGLGTIPVMLAMTLLGKFIGMGVKRFFNKLIPVAGVLLAVIIILRGLSLGIPYISPKVVENPHGKKTMECCHPQDSLPQDSVLPDSISVDIKPDEASTTPPGL